MYLSTIWNNGTDICDEIISLSSPARASTKDIFIIISFVNYI